MADVKKTRLFATVKENVIKMIERRGWHLEPMQTDSNYTICSNSNGKASGMKNIHDFFLAKNHKDDLVVVYFVIDVKVNVDTMGCIINNKYQSKHFIIVYNKSLTPDARTIAKLNKVFVVELFYVDDFAYDIISLVPSHKLHDKSLSPDFHEWSKLPIMLSTDKVARYYGFKSGDIVEIEEDFGRGIEISLRRII